VDGVLPALRTDRLVLRPVRPEEARAVVDGLTVGPDPAVLWAALEYGGPLGWFVVRDGAVIGDCGTHGGVDADGDLEIRYGIASAYRRQGYATEVVGALVRWAGEQPDVRRVVARRVEVGNLGSRRALERCGFVLTDVHDPYVAYALPHGK
jgi:RimJ/RimL family protein N-acetyltransferase